MRCLAIIMFGCFSVLSNAESIKSINSEVLDRRYLIGDHLIVSSWRCTNDGEGVYVNFYDRKSYQELAKIKVLPCDHEYQDEVEYVYKVGGDYLARIKFRYEDPRRPSLIVINGTTLAIKAKLNASEAFRQGYKQKSQRVLNIEDSIANTKISVKKWDSNEYLVERGVKSAAQFTHVSDGPIEEIRLISGGEAIFVTRSNDYLRRNYYLTDITTNQSKLLFSGPLYERRGSAAIAQVGSYSNFLVVNEKLVFGLGRDIQFVNLKTLKAGVISEYLVGGFRDNGNGIDQNRINGLINDEKYQRLIVFCFEGSCNSYIPHSILEKSN